MRTSFEDWLRASIGLGDEWSVEDVDFNVHPDLLGVQVRYTGRPVCPVCGRECPGYDVRRRTWRDLDFGKSRCDVTAEFPRVNCPDHGVREIRVEWAGRASNLTLSFERACLRYSRVMPVRLAADLLGVSESTVWRVVKHYTDHRMRDLDLSGLTRFCIDETSYKKGHRYITSVVNPDTGGVIFGTLGNDVTVLREFRTWLIHHGGNPDRITAVSCDMSRAFTNGVREYFPRAVVCYDHFHVVKLAVDTLEAERRTAGFKGAEGRGLRFWLMRNREDLDADRRSRVDALLNEYGGVSKAYTVKEALRDMYRAPDKETATGLLYAVIDTCLDSARKSIFSLGLALDEHQRGILAWFDVHMSNGVAEGVNSVTKAVQRTARGFRNPENLISLLYLRSLGKNGLGYGA